MKKWLDQYKVHYKDARSGDWEIKKFVVTPEDEKLERLRSMFSSSRGRWVPAGNYTGLYRNGTLVMSDTPDEIRDHMGFISQAVGQVLIGGLGLGVVLKAVLVRPEVAHVVVVEKSPDVITLVSPYFKKERFRLEIIQADILGLKLDKSVHFNCAWYDIWDDMCEDNLHEMHRLHRKFGRHVDWQGSWGRDWIEARRR